ncbi:MAG: mucoidy inhibitor MuiA family protein, partial [Phycisphaerales bacterium]|nr:mucoidy inhibitor MuiA family protein [Phycisphaerales bacterium]
MKLLQIPAFIAITAMSVYALQPVTIEMEPIDANGAITSVTLYRGRAAVTRTAELELEAGGWSVFFTNLPKTATLDSLQASVVGDAKLIAVDTTSFPIEKDNNKLLKEIAIEIERVEAEIALAKADGTSLELQMSFLQTLVQRSSTDQEQVVDLESFQEQLAFIGKQKTTLEHEKLANTKLKNDLTNERNTLVKRRNNISSESTTQQDAIIDIGVFKKGKITIEVTYLVNNASWEPAYSIRATEGGESISIDYDANVSQRTGEDWKDIKLTLSTAQPQRSASPPRILPWFVDVKQPNPP